MKKKLLLLSNNFFLPYVIIIFSMVIFHMINYHFMITNTEKQTVSIINTEIENKANVLSDGYNDVIHVIDEIEFDYSFKELSKQEHLDLMDAYSFSKQLLYTKKSVPIIQNILLYFKKQDVLIDCSSAYKLSGKSSLIGTNDMDFDKFTDVYFNSHYINSYVEIKNLKYMGEFFPRKYVIISSLPRTSENSDMQIIISLDDSYIKDIISLSSAADSVNNLMFHDEYIYDNAIKNIDPTEFHMQSKTKINGQKYILKIVPVQDSPWTYISAINYKNISDSLRGQRLVIYLTLLFAILMCIIISLKFAFKNEKKYNSMLSSNFLLNKTIRSYTPHIKNELLRKIVLNELPTDEALEAISKHSLIPHSDYYAIFRFDINLNITDEAEFSKELKTQKFIINNVMEDLISNYIYINSGPQSICFILYSNKSSEELKKSIDTIKQTTEDVLVSMLNYSLSFASSSIVNSVEKLPGLYTEAGSNIFLEKIANNVNYSENKDIFRIDIEGFLINSVARGQIDSIDAVFDILSESDDRETLYDDLMKTIDKIASALDINDELLKIQNLDSIDECKAFLKRIALSNQKLSLFEKIIKYINENFSNKSLSRTLVASAFDVSEEYISILFKKNFDVSFLSYVEKLRIDYACKLLSEENYTLEKIGELCGFSSQVSFRRTFKKTTGVLPSQYITVKHKESE